MLFYFFHIKNVRNQGVMAQYISLICMTVTCYLTIFNGASNLEAPSVFQNFLTTVISYLPFCLQQN